MNVITIIIISVFLIFLLIIACVYFYKVAKATTMSTQSKILMEYELKIVEKLINRFNDKNSNEQIFIVTVNPLD